MSDRRGEPRNMPPKLETNGLEDSPTLVSNVETFAWVPFICIKGGKAYAAEGVNGWKGRRLFSISGDVKRPGVYEVPMGMTLRELVHGDEYCQGIAGDRSLKAFAPSGPSGGFLPAKLTAGAGLPRDHVNNKTWQALAARRGFDPAATELDILDLELELNLFRALSPTQRSARAWWSMPKAATWSGEAINSLEFFRNESCGKCVPCRIGSQKFVSLGTHLIGGKISAERWKNELVPLIKEMGKAIELASICGLGRSVPMPLLTVAQFLSRRFGETPLAAGNSAVRSLAGDQCMNPELVEGLFIRDDDEGLFSRDIDGQLVRLDAPAAADYEKTVTLQIDGQPVTVPLAEPLKDAQGNIVQDMKAARRRATRRSTTRR